MHQTATALQLNLGSDGRDDQGATALDTDLWLCTLAHVYRPLGLDSGRYRSNDLDARWGSSRVVCLRSGSCTSASTFAQRSSQTRLEGHALALRYDFTSISAKGTDRRQLELPTALTHDFCYRREVVAS